MFKLCRKLTAAKEYVTPSQTVHTRGATKVKASRPNTGSVRMAQASANTPRSPT